MRSFVLSRGCGTRENPSSPFRTWAVTSGFPSEKDPLSPGCVSDLGFFPPMGNGSKTGFSICASLFIFIENDGNLVKWPLPWMVSRVWLFQKMRPSSQKSPRLSTALLGNIFVLMSLVGKLRLSGDQGPNVAELWEVGRRTAGPDWEPRARGSVCRKSFQLPSCP